MALPHNFCPTFGEHFRKAAIETCHKNPRMHNPENVGFGHRECNIAQGAKTLDEFYQWIEAILARVEEEKSL